MQQQDQNLLFVIYIDQRTYQRHKLPPLNLKINIFQSYHIRWFLYADHRDNRMVCLYLLLEEQIPHFGDLSIREIEVEVPQVPLNQTHFVQLNDVVLGLPLIDQPIQGL